MRFVAEVRRAAPIALAWGIIAAVSLVARPALAQVTLGNEPASVALDAGAFDIIPGNHKDSATAGLFGAEYRFGDLAYGFNPFVGGQVTTDGAAYGYFGFGIDVDLGPNWVLTPNGAAGIFERGSGIKLGSWWEFRTGAELDYRLPNQSRIGIAFHHMSNAGLTKENPGEEDINLVYTIPLH